jgi:hypothetical protein
VRREHFHLILFVGLLDQIQAVTAAVRADAVIEGCRSFQCRPLFKKDRDDCPLHFISQLFPIDELSSWQWRCLIFGNHLVHNRLKNLIEPFAGLLPIRQRCHGILHV